jgi:hypothetical protein
MKRWNPNALECESCIIKEQHAQKNFKGFKIVVGYVVIISWKACNSWLTCN